MANLFIIKDILKGKNISIRDFASELRMSEQGLQRLIRDNSTKVETLELISKKLNVSISVFFDETHIEEQPRKEPSREDRLLSLIESQQRTIENLSSKK